MRKIFYKNPPFCNPKSGQAFPPLFPPLALPYYYTDLFNRSIFIPHKKPEVKIPQQGQFRGTFSKFFKILPNDTELLQYGFPWTKMRYVHRGTSSVHVPAPCCGHWMALPHLDPCTCRSLMQCRHCSGLQLIKVDVSEVPAHFRHMGRNP